MATQAEAARFDGDASDRGRHHLDGQVLVRIAHEWRSAVAATSNWLQVLAKPRLDGATHERAVKGLTQSRDLQLQLIEQLQDAVLMLNGGLELERVQVDLRGMLRAAIEPLSALAHQRRVELRVRGGGDEHSGEAVADQHRLRQVLRTVLTAAVNLTTPGGAVEIELRRVQEGAEIAVHSNQVRVAGETLALLLDIPHTPTRLSAPPAPGLGLELPFARHVVERHGGELRLTCDDAGGAVFTLSLPA
jgi:two-component system phosphate regulon sensor histidine kinase PhoR